MVLLSCNLFHNVRSTSLTNFSVESKCFTRLCKQFPFDNHMKKKMVEWIIVFFTQFFKEKLRGVAFLLFIALMYIFRHLWSSSFRFLATRCYLSKTEFTVSISGYSYFIKARNTRYLPTIAVAPSEAIAIIFVIGMS